MCERVFRPAMMRHMHRWCAHVLMWSVPSSRGSTFRW